MSTIKTKPFDLEAIKNGAKWGIYEFNVNETPILISLIKELNNSINLFECITEKNKMTPVVLFWNNQHFNVCKDGSFHLAKKSWITRNFIIKLIQEPKLASDLSEIKVGDKVWDFKMGWGEVENIRKGYNYPITIRFKKDCMTYTMDGKSIEGSNQSLFLTEIKFEISEV